MFIQYVCNEPYLLNIDLNVLLQTVAVQVEDQVMDKVKAVTDDDERQLVGEFGFLFATQRAEGERLQSAMCRDRHRHHFTSHNAIDQT